MVRIIDPLWLEENLSNPNFVRVDPRPVVKYLEGHIPGSVNLPLAKLLDKNTMGLLPLEHLSKAFGEAGIRADNPVVLYDGYDGQNAAMVAWVLEYLGHTHVTLLSCRFESWISEGREVLYKPVLPAKKEFEPRPDESVRASSEELLQRGNVKVLDLRSREEFQGKVATEVRTGHIPSAVNIPWTDLIGEHHDFLRPRPELEAVAKRFGLGPTDEIVTYCTYGPRAAIGYLALQSLGYRAGVYDGSFHDWARRAELPVEGEGLQLEL